MKLGREAGLAFTQLAGAGLRSGNSAVPRVTFYTTLPAAEVADQMGWQPGRKGSEVLVLTPQDPAVGDHGTSVEGLPVCSDGQIYIDLVAAGADYAEQAEAFRPVAARGKTRLELGVYP